NAGISRFICSASSWAMMLDISRTPTSPGLASMVIGFLLADEFRQQLLLFFAQRQPFEQFRPSQPGSAQRLLETPAPDQFMIPTEQHLRYALPCKLFRPGVVRTIQPPFRKRIFHR